MSHLVKWKVRGAVKTPRVEFAEWDLSGGQWPPPRHLRLVKFRPDGSVSESESRNPDGSVWRSLHTYGEAGSIAARASWMDAIPTGKTIYSYDGTGRLARVSTVEANGIERDLETYRYGPDGGKTKVYFVPKGGILSYDRRHGPVL